VFDQQCTGLEFHEDYLALQVEEEDGRRHVIDGERWLMGGDKLAKLAGYISSIQTAAFVDVVGRMAS